MAGGLYTKSNLVPSQCPVYLGAVVDFQTSRVRPTQGHISAVVAGAELLLAAPVSPASFWACFPRIPGQPCGASAVVSVPDEGALASSFPAFCNGGSGPRFRFRFLSGYKPSATGSSGQTRFGFGRVFTSRRSSRG